MNFAKHFKRVRESKGLSAYQLAQRTGLSQQGILNLELAGADPKLSTVYKLAEAMGLEPWKLLPGWKSTGVDGQERPSTSAEGAAADRQARRRSTPVGQGPAPRVNTAVVKDIL